MTATATQELCCPNCGADSHCSRLCDERGDWGAADQVVTCNMCGNVYGHAVPVRYIIEAWKVGTP